jgi:hypothetical protein
MEKVAADHPGRPGPTVRLLPSLPRTPFNLEPPVPAPWTSATVRPLSDIRELSEPSLISIAARNAASRTFQSRNGSPSSRTKFTRPLPPVGPSHVDPPAIRSQKSATRALEYGSSSYSSTPEQSSLYSIPHSSVPQRTSSNAHARRPSTSQTRSTTAPVQQAPARGITARPKPSVANHGHSYSPVKETRLRLDVHGSAEARRVPSQTLIRHPHPVDIIQYPTYRHPRVRLELQLSAPLFVGGGSIEGHVTITVDSNDRSKYRRSLDIGEMAIDLLGFEDVTHGRTATFLALGTELLDANHPPPADMVQPTNIITTGDGYWPLAASSTLLPFMISLPLETGPPPFQSKHASIRFLLSVTAMIRDTGKSYKVRTSQDIQVLSTYDPEKALTSLPSPLTAADEFIMARLHGLESVRVTAGLHRQVWVSGGSIFVDVHISNRTQRPIKKLELTLERDILCYKHAAAATMEKSAVQARIFESNDRTILARSLFKTGAVGWNGVDAHATDMRTCELELPRGHATVRCGKYFEVRYFLNVTVFISTTKLVTVQLPIVLIHMVSLDVVPNSVAQVAAAIEEKRAQSKRSRSRLQDSSQNNRGRSMSSPAQTNMVRRRPSYTPGRAFAAPREQSRDRQKEHRIDLQNLQQVLDESPRRNQPSRLLPRKGFSIRKLSSKQTLQSPSPEQRTPLSVFGAMSYRTPPRPSELKTTSIPQPPLRRKKSDLARPLSAKGIHLGDHPAGPRPMPRKPFSTSSIIRHATDVVPPAHTQPMLSLRPGIPVTNPAVRRQASATSSASSSAAHQRHVFAPQTLGLTADGNSILPRNRQISFGDGASVVKKPPDEPVSASSPPPVQEQRPSTAQSFRDRFDRGRGELRAVVARKASGRSLKERGVGWWEGLVLRKSPSKPNAGPRQMHPREREEIERAGWI